MSIWYVVAVVGIVLAVAVLIPTLLELQRISHAEKTARENWEALQKLMKDEE